LEVAMKNCDNCQACTPRNPSDCDAPHTCDEAMAETVRDRKPEGARRTGRSEVAK
jgi:hypothetical protein